MLGIATLSKLKKQHKYVFHSTIGGIGVTFRLLTWSEWNFYIKAKTYGLDDPFAIEDHIWTEVVLDPLLIDQMNNLPPGLVTTIVAIVMSLSGNVAAQEDDIEALNAELRGVRAVHESAIYEQFIEIVCKAFPGITPLDVEELPFPEVLRLLVISEKILGLEPIDLSKAKRVHGSKTDQLFEDAAAAEKADRARPGGRDIRDVIAKRTVTDPSGRQARQQQMIELIRRRQAMKPR
jgi:hypothetical protein